MKIKITMEWSLKQIVKQFEEAEDANRCAKWQGWH